MRISLQEPIQETVADHTFQQLYQLLAQGSLFLQGTAGFLLLLFLAGLVLYLERLLFLSKVFRYDRHFIQQLRDHLVHNNLVAAKELCLQAGTPVAGILQKGLEGMGMPLETIRLRMDNSRVQLVYKLEKYTEILPVIALISPLIGLLAIIFESWSVIAALGDLGFRATASLLINGLYASAFVTLMGFLLGLLAFLAHSHLRVIRKKAIYILTVQSGTFLEMLQEPADPVV
ncbi:MAG: MotA/TolQ/ExbB proton channel family protein [Lutibacter sp.]|jgi:biopolymer transport protein ExbB|nr:MotA/TolQ/ExbB proton channel family protein [Lutibacter sp.]